MVSSTTLFQIILHFTCCLLCSGQGFIFNGFHKASKSITLDGSARTTHEGILQLTNYSNNLVGHAFFSSPIQMIKNQYNTSKLVSFSTTFIFQIVSTDGNSDGGHGLTFAFAPSKELPGAYWGEYLGLLGPTNNGNFSNHVFAVEFDTVSGPFDDLEQDHVGIDINDLRSNVSQTAAYYAKTSTKAGFSLEDVGRIQAWIEYDSFTNVLNVTVAPLSVHKPSRPLISCPIDLMPIFKEKMYVGFTSSTEKLASSHYILAWSFRTEGTAEAIDISNLPEFPHSKRNRDIIKIVGVSVAIFSCIMLVIIVISLYLRQKAKLAETIEDWELDHPHRLRYKELYRATKGFNKTELLGSGGFGNVYKGILRHNKQVVAIKKITNNTRQGMREFVAEVSSLGRLRHRNLVELRGWCKRNEDLIIVYEFMPNGSLDALLFNHKNNADVILSWEQRLNILKGVTSGLLYLHEEWEKVVVHRDIKSSNVLLKSDMTAKLGDFGLARLYNHGTDFRTTCAAGTLGYMAPEVLNMGKVTTSSDVFAFGVLLLEVVCGRRSIEHSAPDSERNLVQWVRDYIVRGELTEVIDPRMGNEYDIREVEIVLRLGILCCQYKAELRPSMRQVNQYLNGNERLAGDLSNVFLETDSVDSGSTKLFSLSCETTSTISLQGGSFGDCSSYLLDARREGRKEESCA